MSCTQNATMKSQRKDKTVGNSSFKEICRRKTVSELRNVHGTLFTVTIILLISLCSPPSAAASACPSQCSCTGDSVAFCNNNEYTAFPSDITSAVRKLYLFNNHITTIPRESMTKLRNLTLLDISGNRITNYALWDGVFNRLTHLENLMLQKNQISIITSNMFKGLSKLARIYLQFNQISVIKEGAFDNLPSLVELKLRNNRLVSFPVLKNTPKLLLLDLSHNKLRTIRDTALSTVNVEQLLIQDNQLTELRTAIFDDTSRLRHIDISNNRLTAVPQIIKSLTSVQSLNMSLNRISSIPVGTFSKLLRLKTLDLRRMSLASLPYGIIPPGLILNVFDIRQNNFTCNCSISWLPQYIRIFEEAFVDPDSVKCTAPQKLRNRKIRDLSQDDFGCTEEDISKTLLPPIESLSTSTTEPRTTSHKQTVDPCDVYYCFNGGTCVVKNKFPHCQCNKDWAGGQCQKSLTTPTTTTTTMSTTTTTRKLPESPSLLVNSNSITETSVEIILPQTNSELLLSVSEKGKPKAIKEMRINPTIPPYTIKGLEAGKVYNICIHSPLVSKRHRLSNYIKNRDSLCAEVKTDGEITVNPQPPMINNPDGKEPPTTIDEPGDGDTHPGKPGGGGKLHGSSQPVTTTTQNDDFHILYPALGAGLGLLIIVIMMVTFFVCYRQKRMLKKKQNSDYIPGSPIDPNHTSDMEMATVVHHHHHNHYNASGVSNGSAAKRKKGENQVPKAKNQQSALINNNSHPKRVTTPNKSNSLSRSSNSSSSNCGTLQTRYVDSPYAPPGTQQHYGTANTPPHLPYESMPPTMPLNGRGNEYIYRNHQNNNNSVLPMANNHLPHGRGYETEALDERRPLVNGMNQYNYSAGDGTMYTDNYPIAHMNGPQYLPQTGGLSYPQANARSAFQPIQSPRKNTVRTPTSDSGPITTHVNTAHVLPTSTCIGMNIMNENVPIYRNDGVPVA